MVGKVSDKPDCVLKNTDNADGIVYLGGDSCLLTTTLYVLYFNGRRLKSSD